MRIATQSVDEFLESLQDVTDIFDNTIRVSVNRRSNSEHNLREAPKVDILIQVACVVQIDGGEYLLETGEFCGVDYNDATQDFQGTKKADQLKSKIQILATAKKWRILPGMISE